MAAENLVGDYAGIRIFSYPREAKRACVVPVWTPLAAFAEHAGLLPQTGIGPWQETCHRQIVAGVLASLTRLRGRTKRLLDLDRQTQRFAGS